MSIIETILQWPVIVQGALGSALFALTFWLCQLVMKRLISSSKKFTSDLVGDLKARDSMIEKAESWEDKIHVLGGLVYVGFHYLIKALIFLVLGHLIGSFIPVFGYVGTVIGMFYLFRALVCCPDLNKYESQ
ncbi:hypothetical protein ACEV8P_23010 [Vibrio parahaemolyticus]